MSGGNRVLVTGQGDVRERGVSGAPLPGLRPFCPRDRFPGEERATGSSRSRFHVLPSPHHRNPPRHRRPPPRRPRSPRRPDHAHGPKRRAPHRVLPPPRFRRTREVCDRRHLHRRRHRVRPRRRQVPRTQCRPHAHRHPLLVLRRRDHRHGPAAPEGHLGFQRHRPPRRRLPCRRPRRAQPEGPPRLFDLRPRSPGAR